METKVTGNTNFKLLIYLMLNVEFVAGICDLFPRSVDAFWVELLEAEYYHVCDEINISLPREKTPAAQEDGLASTPLQAMRSCLTAGEKQEDADNLKNSTRASQAGLNSNAIHIPVTITAPPGETTLIPSEYHCST